jgi:APA family basic amino acid/polyamine antiporter
VAPGDHVGGGGLVRGLGAWDATLLVIGSVLGGGIFLTTSDMARAVPHQGVILLVWIGGGLMTLAGALTYAELGVLFPRAGGIYNFLKEAYGPLWGFLYGWGGFVAIMGAGNAAVAVGTAEYLGAFVPLTSTANVLYTARLGAFTWTLSGGQLAAAALIVALTAINWIGLRYGAAVQNGLTAIKVVAVVGIVGVAFALPARCPTALAAALPRGGLFAGIGIAMVAALWTYDGWYGLTFSVGELRDPGRNLPLGLVTGTFACTAMYVALNLVYFRALPVAEIAASPRVAETAATALVGAAGGRLLAAAVLVSSLGCLAASILYSSRLYLPMAEDGLFFRSLARIHPRFHTPGPSLWAQGAWSAALAFSGRYDQLYTTAILVSVLFHAATGAAVFVFRRRLPDAPRPYRVWGYPVTPALFILASLALIANTLLERPVESLIGVGLLALGLPAYAHWRRGAAGVSGAGPRVDDPGR